MKVLYSINRPHTDNIKSGRKLWEIRKTKPNIPVPFTSLIYETKKKGGCGKVIGEFICDKIHEIEYCGSQYLINKDIALTNRVAKESCLYYDDLREYIGTKKGYALHISDLKIYDKPKELSEFRKPSKEYHDIRENEKGYLTFLDGYIDGEPLTRPPQSWCYVEE